MKSLGLVGTYPVVCGTYAVTINAEIQKEFGGRHTTALSAQFLDQAEIDTRLADEAWAAVTEILITAGRHAIAAGVDGLVLCGSALNPVAEEVRQALDIPVLSIGYAMARRLESFRIQRVALLGVRTQREEQMWIRSLPGVRVILPTSPEFLELSSSLRYFARLGQALPDSFHTDALRLKAFLRSEGAQAAILAAPELKEITWDDESHLRIFDAAELHASVAGMWIAHRDMGITQPCCLP